MPPDDGQRPVAREPVDDVLGEAFGEGFVARIAAEIPERQDRYSEAVPVEPRGTVDAGSGGRGRRARARVGAGRRSGGPRRGGEVGREALSVAQEAMPSAVVGASR